MNVAVLVGEERLVGRHANDGSVDFHLGYFGGRGWVCQDASHASLLAFGATSNDHHQVHAVVIKGEIRGWLPAVEVKTFQGLAGDFLLLFVVRGHFRRFLSQEKRLGWKVVRSDTINVNHYTRYG